MGHPARVDHEISICDGDICYHLDDPGYSDPDFNPTVVVVTYHYRDYHGDFFEDEIVYTIANDEFRYFADRSAVPSAPKDGEVLEGERRERAERTIRETL